MLTTLFGIRPLPAGFVASIKRALGHETRLAGSIGGLTVFFVRDGVMEFADVKGSARDWTLGSRAPDCLLLMTDGNGHFEIHGWTFSAESVDPLPTTPRFEPLTLRLLRDLQADLYKP